MLLGMLSTLRSAYYFIVQEEGSAKCLTIRYGSTYPPLGKRSSRVLWNCERFRYTESRVPSGEDMESVSY